MSKAIGRIPAKSTEYTAMTQSNHTDLSGGSSRHPSHWRSAGWTPLAYPSSAIVVADHEQDSNSSNLNKHFPLHQDVLLAAIRELLILDRSIDKMTLEVIGGGKYTANDDTSKKQKSTARRYLRHIVDDAAEPKNAEDIAGIVLERTVGELQNEANEAPTYNGNDKPPRKVSDADIVSSNALGFASSRSTTTLTPGQLVLVSNGCHVSVADMSRANIMSQLPPLLDISISTETHLRDKAYETIARMTSTFDERPLREFLGYKSNTPKRDRIVEVMADLLFDISHAMFAWEQTEREVFIEQGGGGNQQPESLDQKICSDLFDSRALKKIGGFDFSSLLPHALSIRRARMNKVSWKAFAASGQGRKMLRHHREGSAAIAGQKRRRQRPRSRSSQENDRDGKRSRSSSVVSTSDESECRNEKPNSANFDTSTVNNGDTSTFNIVPDVIPLTIKREKGERWGISLAKEGSMCIVDRIPKEKEWNGLLKIGDMIVSIKNERDQSVSLPSTSSLPPFTPTLLGEAAAHTQRFYRQVVDLFKVSDTLFLEVRRVGAIGAMA